MFLYILVSYYIDEIKKISVINCRSCLESVVALQFCCLHCLSFVAVVYYYIALFVYFEQEYTSVASANYLLYKSLYLITTVRFDINPIMDTLKQQSNTVIGRLAIDGWTVTFGTATRGLGGRSPPRPLLAVPNVTVHPSTASLPTSYIIRCSTKV